MTLTNSSYPGSPNSHSSPLKVVPPVTRNDEPAAFKEPSSVASPTTTPTLPNSVRISTRWLAVGAIGVGLAGIGLIPLPHYVTGSAEVISTQKARQTVTMPVRGLVMLSVEPNQTVQPGQLIAQVKSEELEDKIAAAAIALEQAQNTRVEATQKLNLAQSQLQVVSTEEQNAQKQVDKSRAELDRIARGNRLPEIRQLESEIDGLNSEMAGYRQQLALVEAEIQDYSPLAEQGALPRSTLRALMKEQATLMARVEETHSGVAGKSHAIAGIVEQHQDELERAQRQLAQTQAARVSAQAVVVAQQTAVASAQQMVEQFSEQLQRFEHSQQQLELRATTTGTVVRSDLDLLHRRHLEAGEEILSIVDLTHLSAAVQVRQEDAALVKTGLSVTFHPRNAERQSYAAQVQERDIAPVVRVEETQQQRAMMVRILIDNQDAQLRPGEKGTAHIAVGKMPIYQKLQREFLRLVPIERWKFFLRASLTLVGFFYLRFKEQAPAL